MKLRENNSMSSMISVFENFGATSDEIECIKNYLESEIEDESLLDGVRMRDLKAQNRLDDCKCREIQEKLTKKKEDELSKRFLRALFALGGSTICNFIYMYGAYETQMHEYLTPTKHTAVHAESSAWNEYALTERYILSFKTRCLENPDIAMDAVKYCIGEYDNAKVLLWGFAYNTILSQGDNASNSEILKTFKKDYVDNIIDSLCNLATGLDESEVKVLCDYIDSYSDGMQPTVEVNSICRKAAISSGVLANLLCGSAALNFQYSSHLRAFLQICINIGINTVCDAIMVVNDSEHDRIFAALEGFAICDFAKYFMWCAKNKYIEPVERLYASKKTEYRLALKNLDVDRYNTLVSAIEKIDPEKYAELKNDTDAIKRKIAFTVAEHVMGEEENIIKYIMGEITLEELFSRVKFGSVKISNIYKQISYNQLENYRKSQGTDQLARRAYCVYAIIDKFAPITRLIESKYENGHRNYNEASITSIFDMFNEEELPLKYQLYATEAIFDWAYGDDEKLALAQILCKCMVPKIKENPEEFYSKIEFADAPIRKVALLAFGTDPKAYKDYILKFNGDTSKVVRATLISILTQQSGWEEDVLDMAKSKKSAQRETAVKVLTSWESEKYRELFASMLEKEKSKAVIDLINNALGASSDNNGTTANSEESTQQIAERFLKGNKLRSLQWLGDLPEVKMADGTPAEPDYVAVVMLAYSSMQIPGISSDAAKIAETLDAGSLDKYACEVFSRWLDDGAQAKKKWVLYFASIHGGHEVAQSLISHINKWPLESRGAIAAEAVKALALNSAPEALLTVDTISRKFKFKQVKAAAVEALKFAAAQLGISTEELADRIVPNLGFNEKMEKIMDYGTRQFTIKLNPALEIEVFDSNGKRMKNLPSPGQKDDPNLAPEAYNEFKALKKSIKATVNTQKIRMELALSTGRKWQSDAWNKLFVCNPIMHQFAMSLIWGVYENEKLIQTFRYMEDGTFNTEDEEEYDLPEQAVIGLVHPLELSEESISVWKEQLEDYEIKQCIEQLERPTYKPTEEELKTDRVLVGAGKVLNGLSLLGKMTTLGWYKGSVQDAGCFYSFYRENVAEGINVQIGFSGMYVAGEDEDVTVCDAVFYKAGTVEYGSYVYDNVKPENVVKISDLSPRVYSEIALSINRATISSTEFDENWKN